MKARLCDSCNKIIKGKYYTREGSDYCSKDCMITECLDYGTTTED